MKVQRTRLLLLSVPALLLASPACRADTVDLGVGGHLYGEYDLAPGQVLSESFTLDQATQVTSFQVGISPYLGGLGMLNGSYQVILTGPDGSYEVAEYASDGITPDDWLSAQLPSILSAGQYTLSFDGGTCGTPCYGYVAGIDYYFSPSYTQLGGSLGAGYPNGEFGWALTGTTVPDAAVAPEPGTWLLLATGLLSLSLLRHLRRVRKPAHPA